MICNLNVWVISTFVHYVEKKLGVPYRFDKLFPGVFSIKGTRRKGAAVFFCRDLSNPDTGVATEAFDALALETGLARKVNVGRGYVTAISGRDMSRLIEETLPKRPYFLIQAGQQGIVPKLLRPGVMPTRPLPARASMEQMIEALWELPRDIVSDGYDAALRALATQAPVRIHEFPTGTSCWSWIIPEKWTCHEAWLETMDGRRLFSYATNPLHVVSYSLPLERVVSREELFRHLHTHPRQPDAIPFVFKYYERDWGLCCSQRLKETLNEPSYRVVIRTEFSYGTLKVGEVFVPGQSEETIVLCAHLCHPHMVADDLSGVVVGLEVMRELMRRTDRRFSYRFLILPETIGSAAYLSRHESLLSTFKGGLFLEMTSLPNPPALQLSFNGRTQVDKCFTLALQEHDPAGWTGVFRAIIGNDERQFNAPGVRVPMLSLSRVLRTSSPDWPYPAYHSSHDTPAGVSHEHLADSVRLVLRMLQTLEDNRVPQNRFKGEVFCSRYGVHIDYYSNPGGHRALFDVMYLVDGTRSIADIALECQIPFSVAHQVIAELHRCGLVDYSDAHDAA